MKRCMVIYACMCTCVCMYVLVWAGVKELLVYLVYLLYTVSDHLSHQSCAGSNFLVSESEVQGDDRKGAGRRGACSAPL